MELKQEKSSNVARYAIKPSAEKQAFLKAYSKNLTKLWIWRELLRVQTLAVLSHFNIFPYISSALGCFCRVCACICGYTNIRSIMIMCISLPSVCSPLCTISPIWLYFRGYMWACVRYWEISIKLNLRAATFMKYLCVVLYYYAEVWLWGTPKKKARDSKWCLEVQC